MATGMKLILVDNTQGNDITDLVQQVKWGGRKGASSRTIEVFLLDDENMPNARAEIDVEKGQQCIFIFNGEELFRGIIMSQSRNQKKQLTFKAYDNGIYLANNKDTFNYQNKTATYIFKDICLRFGIPFSEAAETSYKIPELTKPNTTAFDAICDALSQDFAITGVRHYVDSQKGYLRLLTRRENILQWVIESGQNLTSYDSKVSIEKIRTRIKLISNKGTVLAEKSNPSLEAKFGIMQEIDSPDNLNAAQLNELVSSMLEEQSKPENSLKVEALGIPDVISGTGVFIIIPALNISRTYYVDEDSHVFKDQYHRMTLTLTAAHDIKATASDLNDGKYQVGDMVYFLGGNHYVSSSSSSPTGGTRREGQAKITAKAPGAKHPYHLIGGVYSDVEGNSNVYGWVDESSIK